MGREAGKEGQRDMKREQKYTYMYMKIHVHWYRLCVQHVELYWRNRLQFLTKSMHSSLVMPRLNCESQ